MAWDVFQRNCSRAEDGMLPDFYAVDDVRSQRDGAERADGNLAAVRVRSGEGESARAFLGKRARAGD